jgi:hypothetical protein
MIYQNRMIEGKATPVYEVALTFKDPLKDLAQVLAAH